MAIDGDQPPVWLGLGNLIILNGSILDGDGLLVGNLSVGNEEAPKSPTD